MYCSHVLYIYCSCVLYMYCSCVLYYVLQLCLVLCTAVVSCIMYCSCVLYYVLQLCLVLCTAVVSCIMHCSCVLHYVLQLFLVLCTAVVSCIMYYSGCYICWLTVLQEALYLLCHCLTWDLMSFVSHILMRFIHHGIIAGVISVESVYYRVCKICCVTIEL